VLLSTGPVVTIESFEGGSPASFVGTCGAGLFLSRKTGMRSIEDPRSSSKRSRGVAAHHDSDVAALLEVRIEDRFAGRAPPRLRHLENQGFSRNSYDDVSF
jgi:hypothetical protein